MARTSAQRGATPSPVLLRRAALAHVGPGLSSRCWPAIVRCGRRQPEVSGRLPGPPGAGEAGVQPPLSRPHGQPKPRQAQAFEQMRLLHRLAQTPRGSWTSATATRPADAPFRHRATARRADSPSHGVSYPDARSRSSASPPHRSCTPYTTAAANVSAVDGGRWIRPRIAQCGRLVEQRRGPHMWVIDEALAHVLGHGIERVRPGRRPDSRLALAVDVGADGLAVSARWRAIAEIVQPCFFNACAFTSSFGDSMVRGPLGLLAWQLQHRRDPTLRYGTHAIPASPGGEIR